jgi:hypothetical protein
MMMVTSKETELECPVAHEFVRLVDQHGPHQQALALWVAIRSGQGYPTPEAGSPTRGTQAA